MLSLSTRADGWEPPIVKTVATESRGVEELAAAVESYRGFQQEGEASLSRRTSISRWRLLELLRERLLARALSGEGADARLDRLAAEVASKRRDPYSAVEEFIAAGAPGETREG
jgi:LAO/AO transport system kinase